MKRVEAKRLTREKILEIAETLFVKTGFTASTLEIARQANIAHGTLFFHFKHRDELVLEIIRRLVLRITNILYESGKHASNLDEFLNSHLQAMYKDWPLFRSLLIGFANFNKQTQQEVMTLLSGINAHTIEAFEKWSDNGLLRSTLWQGTLVYLSFLGEYMFDKKKVSKDFTQGLIKFLTSQIDIKNKKEV